MTTKSRGILFALVGFILIVFAVAIGYVLLRGSSFGLAPRPEPTAVPVLTTSVLVASHDVFVGEILNADDVTTMEVPAEIVPRNAFTDPEQVYGKFIKADLIQGEMILAHHVADPTNNNHDLGYILDDNHVMMAFPATDLISTESVLKTGDIVDVFVTLPQTVKKIAEDGTEEEEEVTQLFTFNALQKMEITAMVMDIIVEEEEEQQPLPLAAEEGGEAEAVVDESTMNPDYNIRAYLLAMDPQDALLIKYLKDAGAIFDFVLRSPTSETTFDLTPVTEEYLIELFGLEIIP